MDHSMLQVLETDTLCQKFGIQSQVRIILVKLQVLSNKPTPSELKQLISQSASSVTKLKLYPVKNQEHTYEKLSTCKLSKFSSTSTKNYSQSIQKNCRIKLVAPTVEKPFACNYLNCNFRCSIKSNLKKHTLTHLFSKHNHEIGPKFSCLFCSKELYSKAGFHYHMTSHTGEKQYSCKFCKYRFATAATTKRHEIKCEAIQNRKSIHKLDDIYWNSAAGHFQCTHCSYNSRVKQHFKRHSITHTDHKPFQCLMCPLKFSEKYSLKLHTKRQHGDREKPFKCPYCEFTSAYESNISKHIQNCHTGAKRVKNFNCNYCQKSFYLKGTLTEHIQTHTGQKPFTCQFCSKSFGYTSTKNLHELRCQSQPNFTRKNEPFKCDYCEFTSITKGAMNVHTRKHTGEKRYACALCDCKLVSKESLEGHMRRHTNERPFKCSHCNYEFYTSSNLKVHVLRHSGEKNHACLHCSSTFYTRSNLMRHSKNVHREKK